MNQLPPPSTSRLRSVLLTMALAVVGSLPFGEVGGAAYAQISVTALPKVWVGGYHIKCNGGTDGEINTVVTGNVGPYTVVWSNAATTTLINGLVAGTYWVTATDSLNNTASDTVVLVQPGLLTAGIGAHTFNNGTHISEHGASDGEMYSNIQGGIPPYTFLWTPGNHTEHTYKFVPAGQYTLDVTDAGGCTAQAQQTLTEPAELSVTVTLIEKEGGYHLSGCGTTDGEAVATATGGAPPYKYFWSTTQKKNEVGAAVGAGSGTYSLSELVSKHVMQGDSAIGGLGAGLNKLAVEDANGATTWAEFELVAPEKLLVDIATNDLYPNGYHVSCHNCNNATLTAVVTGGTPPFVYQWYRGQEDGPAQLQNAGDPFYQLMVYDANKCFGEAMAKLQIPERDDWAVSGNSGLDAEGNPKWLGTTDSTDLLMKANNQPMLRVGADGVVDVLGQLRVENLGGQTQALLMANSDGTVAKLEVGQDHFVNDTLYYVAATDSTSAEETVMFENFRTVAQSPTLKALGNRSGECTATPQWSVMDTYSGWLDQSVNIRPCPNANVNIGEERLIVGASGTYHSPAKARLHIHASAGGGAFEPAGRNLRLSRAGVTTQFGMRLTTNAESKDVLVLANATSDLKGIQLQSDGNVGVGTFAPQARLQVNGSLSVFSTSGNSSLFFGAEALASNTFGKWGIQYADGGLNFWVPYVTGNSNPGNHRLFLKDNGNVGVGTSEPESKLHIYGDIQIDGSRLHVNGASGKIGIGTNSPVESLQIQGTYAKMRVGNADSYVLIGRDGSHPMVNSVGGPLMINYYNGNDVVFGAPSTNSGGGGGNISVRIFGDLTVCDKLNIVTNEFCDFVFDPSYKRRSFLEKEAYYRANRHLPSVPSEREILERGLDVETIIKGLTINVEELSLDQIDLYKMILELKEENRVLKNQVELLLNR